ncbi:MAG: hypothetical protein CMP14_00560 [Rickettsiales bacterium]|jgi:hypothetical protein|nr:hypothetical protein [Rickettsiales bacterium]
MSSEGSRIPPAGTAIGEIGQASPREQNTRPINSPSPSGRRRYFADSTDIEAAIDRLAQLLAADTNGPRTDVPPGYYLNILV